MPSYTQYLRQMAALDADDSDIESWITVKGNHIPIKKGQSKEDAVKSFIESKGGSVEKGSNQKSELGLIYHKDKGHVKEGRPPKGWSKVEGALTAPNGYSWYSNGKSMFGGERESYLYKDEEKKEKTYNDKGLYQDALNELNDQIADKEKELENIHLSMTENAEAGYFDIASEQMQDVEFVKGQLNELKKKREKLAGTSEKKAPSEAKTIAEFETVRKNALANPNLYGGKYTQKSKYDAYKEYKNDTSSKENMQKANEFVNSELVSKKENGRKERPVHISEALNDVMAEAKEKMESNKKKD